LAIGVGKQVRLLDPKSDMKTAAPVRVLEAERGVGETINFSADGRVLLTTEGKFADDFYAVNVWETASGKRLRHYQNDKTEMHVAAMAPDGKSFVAPGMQNNLRLFSVATGAKIRDLSGAFNHDTPPFEIPFIYGLTFSPDGKWLAGTGCYFEGNGHLTLWEVASGKLKWSRNFYDCGVAIAWAPDSSRVAAGTSYNTDYDEPNDLHRPTGASIWSANGKWQRSLQRVPGKIKALAWAPDCKTLATGAKDGAVRLWKVG
jgi:WD40 repeat protein